jgi:hypothetical protein
MSCWVEPEGWVDNWTPAQLDAARAAIQKVIDEALPAPVWLATKIPANANATEVTEKVRELAGMCVRLDPLERATITDQIFKHLAPHVPKKPARKVFDEELKQRDAEVKKKAAEERKEEAAKKRKTRNTGKMRGHVFSQDGALYREGPTGEKERVSNFDLEPTHVIVREDGQDLFRCRVRIPYEGWDEGGDGVPTTQVLVEEWVIPAEAWSGARKFKLCVPHFRCATSMSDDDLQGLKELLGERSMDLPRIRSTSVLGRHTLPDGSIRFVLPVGTMDAEGWMDSPDLVYLADGGGSFTSRLPGRREECPSLEEGDLLREVLPNLLDLHHPECIAAMTGWFFSSLVAPALRGLLSGAPILNLFASAAAGKSSLLSRVFWPLFTGIRGRELMSCTSTQWALIKDFTISNAVPLVFDELRNDMLEQNQSRFFRLLRRSYTGETEGRGRADQGMNVYPLLAPAVVAGEIKIEGDEALASRCLFVGLDANWIAKHPESREAYRSLSSRPLFRLGSFLQRWSLRQDILGAVECSAGLLDSTVARLGYEDVPERVRSNLVWTTAGLELFGRISQEQGLSSPRIPYAGMIHRLLQEVRGEDPEQPPETTGVRVRPSFVRSNLDDLLVDVALMASLRVLREGLHYVWLDGKLCLWLDGIEVTRAIWRREHGAPPAPVGAFAIKRRAREMMAQNGSSYVVDVGRVVAMEDEKRHRCIVVDVQKIPLSLGIDLDGFERKYLRTHGGLR